MSWGIIIALAINTLVDLIIVKEKNLLEIKKLRLECKSLELDNEKKRQDLHKNS